MSNFDVHKSNNDVRYLRLFADIRILPNVRHLSSGGELLEAIVYGQPIIYLAIIITTTTITTITTTTRATITTTIAVVVLQ